MIASILIIAVSLVLFAYWFRYTCVLILSTRTTKDYSTEVAEANQLSFAAIQEVLGESETGDLDSIRISLKRDYLLVRTLLDQAASMQAGSDTLELIMLRVDYRLMDLYYTISRSYSEAKSRTALAEMSKVVGYFANAVGERVACSARA